MATRSVTLAKTQTSAQPCPCGCAPCEETCCSLDCLVQPRFFCGQLLTDQDLTALLNWTQDKLRLTRYRHGWGVVCGLEVRCDPQQCGRVIVGPGYAVSCCGDDIIVCEETAFDLSDACREAEDPCATLEEPGQVDNGAKLVDLYIRYKEELSNPQTALGRSVCREAAKCEYSRTHETFTLAWQPTVIGSDPLRAEAEDWHAKYSECLDVVDDFLNFLNQFTSLAEHAEDIRRWLVRWIDNHPSHQFCFVRDWVCDMEPEELADEASLVKVLFWLVQDRRNTFLNCSCHSCQERSGVPLAQVWLQAKNDKDKGCCHVLGIDAYPPYRRPIRSDCWPAALGQVNLGRLIWHRSEEACVTLADLGVQVDGEVKFEFPATLAELKTELDCSLFVPCGDSVSVQYFEADESFNGVGMGQRVLGFCGAPPPSGLGVAVVKSSDMTEVGPGAQVTYNFDVTNTGETELTVKVDDSLLGEIVSDVILSPGTTETFSKNYVVPDDAPDQLENKVTVTGVDADGQEVTATDTHLLKITGSVPPPGSGDDLEEIDGIGDSRAETLRRAGIATFEALAAAPIERLQGLFPGVSRTTLARWQKEARELA